MNHPIQAVASPQHSLIYLFSYAIIFSTIILIPNNKMLSGNIFGSVSIINALGFTLVIFLEVMTFYANNYAWIFITISILSIAYSIVLKSRINKLFAPAFYACFGFMTLSMAIYGYLKFPNAYFLLAFQSLLVVSLALWYRSKIIVVVNTLVFLSILVLYLSTSPSINAINFMFAIVALLTARPAAPGALHDA